MAGGAIGALGAPSAFAEQKVQEGNIETLGFANRYATWDSEFRYDGVVTAPAGQGIASIHYDRRGNEANPEQRSLTRKNRGQGGWDDEYEVIDSRTVGGKNKITFTARGDSFTDTVDCKETNGRKYRTTIWVTLTDGTVQVVKPEAEVMRPDRCGDQINTGKPFVRLPYDRAYWNEEPRNSQAGFGYYAEDGYVPARKFFVDLVNPRQGVSNVSCNQSGEVYWQLVRPDGTPADLTPQPQRLAVPGHADASKNKDRIRDVGPLDLSKEKAGYYKFLVWPQASGGACEQPYNKNDQSKAFQIGSVYNKIGDAAEQPDAAPAPVIIKPAAGSTVGPKVKFEGTASYDKDVRKVKLTDKGSGAELGTANVNSQGGTWSLERDLAAGNHTVTATNVSSDNKTGVSSEVSFKVSAETKKVSITTPSNNSTVNTPRVKFTGTGEPGTKVLVKGHVRDLCDSPVDAAGNWSCTSFVELPTGDYAIIADDGKTRDTVRFRLESPGIEPVAVSITSPAENSTVNTPKVTFRGEGAPGAKVEVKGNSGRVVCDATVADAGTWSCTSGFALPVGDYEMTAEQLAHSAITKDKVKFRQVS
ncbi:Ig-like domain-containing protein [Streptomyces pathocidini]|uniref:Ig-like domain-containing protein n=1 Tax=Streptomyces pathocidini TaxID=1650571 RepID=A0ABW7UUH7_9ACTN|nr:Ig-like domain-containing protein [Streptomyces pathocidini]